MADGYVESREFLPQITSRNDHGKNGCLVSRIDDIMSTESTLQSWANESSILLQWRQPFLSLYDYEPQRTKKMYQGFGRPVSHPSGRRKRPEGLIVSGGQVKTCPAVGRVSADQAAAQQPEGGSTSPSNYDADFHASL
jgi:hypothetical protein